MYGGNPFPVFPSSRGFSPEPLSQKSGMSRPSGKSIYKQRKEYAESMSRQQDNFQYRLEHLFTCELDGRELSTIEDCVTRLKSLDNKGKVWGQDMILRIQGNHLQLCDIETKEVLESVQLNSIKKTNTVLDSCMYDSLLIIVVQDYSQRAPQAYLFQCEESGAQDVLNDLNRAIGQGGGDITPPLKAPQMDIRSNLETIIGQGIPGELPSTPPPPEYPPPQFNNYQDYDEREPSPTAFTPRDDLYEREQSPTPNTDMERNVEIFNHVAEDIEIFGNKVAAALPKNEGNKKKKKSKKTKNLAGNLPNVEEYIACLQKVKYGFNLLGKLDGYLKNIPSSEYVHSIFTSIGFVVSHYPPNIPPTVLSPMLTEKALLLLRSAVTSEEDKLWESLGDCWNIPRSRWPNGDQIPPYYPVFYDGWQAPPPSQSQTPISRGLPLQQDIEQFERFPPRNISQMPPEQDDRPWSTPPIRRSPEAPLYMRAMYDFMARNSRELSVMKGEVVQVTNKSKQWWKVKKGPGEEGHVPHNVLEPVDREAPANFGGGGQNMRRPPSLVMNSRPEEVRAWLQYKGFSKGTVQSLGVFDGALLLGMKQGDIRAICPEEGSRVFFQLQSVRSAIALASETEYP